MIDELEIPARVPVMTLSRAVLFPQAIMPIYIFEDHYRTMLKDVLAHGRVFAVAAANPAISKPPQHLLPHTTAGLGLVRACRTHPDGTSNLLLQGLTRVKLKQFEDDNNYLVARAEQLLSDSDISIGRLEDISTRTIGLVQHKADLDRSIPSEVVRYLKGLKNHEAVLDMAIHTVCRSTPLKQHLLEICEVNKRFELFKCHMLKEISHLKLDQELYDEASDEAGDNQ
ncbi:LON peptidase substrate-binding domain-containing protein [Coraliomargarita akajimensis]|uniref:Peptidase S16 lon domain protein n=1 Tax=Coraliomargarita akajimensis (strain DSM 45221 / IAM 15411 / JCM 23193 / KCTC 12865 / 04OKA010-24) TaxID=583355 RepID=D5EHR5_CORAD|nr:LON peptidase substrate-binding domain-containing protein [Coraliomargarita akajimensis]ADE54106.1 peptidase S16 lon domain protein [Coraliomargarita akajimensis DSM 45221]